MQAERKEQKLVPQDKISVWLSISGSEKLSVEKNKEVLLKEFRAKEIFIEAVPGMENGKYSIKISHV